MGVDAKTTTAMYYFDIFTTNFVATTVRDTTKLESNSAM